MSEGSRRTRQRPGRCVSSFFRSLWTESAYLERGKVDDIVNVWVLGKDLVQRGLVGDVALVEGWPLAADELDAVDDFLGGVVEVVDDDDLVVCLEERERCEGANVASATGRMLVNCLQTSA
jgi:hypothetical protein